MKIPDGYTVKEQPLIVFEFQSNDPNRENFVRVTDATDPNHIFPICSDIYGATTQEVVKVLKTTLDVYAFRRNNIGGKI